MNMLLKLIFIVKVVECSRQIFKFDGVLFAAGSGTNGYFPALKKVKIYQRGSAGVTDFF
jgi:hypothetical protein